MRSIGELARASGLTVSALRFYDGAGVFGPAWVDPHTGYRWYDSAQLADARLLCRLRRVGLPLAAIRLVLTAAPGSATPQRVLEEHLRRLEDGLADARRELSAVRALLDHRETPMTRKTSTTTMTIDAAELAAALDAVRFAAADHPRPPVPGGVLFDVEPDGAGGPALRLVATDRYRLAHARIAVDGLTGPAAGAIVPTPVVDGMRALLADGGAGTLTLTGAGVTLESAGRVLSGPGADEEFPDYRGLTRFDTAAATRFASDALRAAVLDADGPDVTVLAHTGGVVTVASGEPGPGEARVTVNRRYFLEAVAAVAAVDAGPSGQLLLELAGPRSPLAIRDAHDPGRFSILMPIARTA